MRVEPRVLDVIAVVAEQVLSNKPDIDPPFAVIAGNTPAKWIRKQLGPRRGGSEAQKTKFVKLRLEHMYIPVQRP